MKMRTVRQNNYSSVMKLVQDMHMLLAKLPAEQSGDEDAIEAQAKVDEGEELLKALASSLQSGEGPDQDEVKAFISSIKPSLAKVKKVATKKEKKGSA